MSNYAKRDYVGEWVSYKIVWEDWGSDGRGYSVEFTTYTALSGRLTSQIEQYQNLKATLSGALK